MTHPLAIELNETLRRDNPYVLGMLSELGRELYFPRGILTQTAEARQKAKRLNATIGIAREKGRAMHLPAVMKRFAGMDPDELFPYAPAAGLPDLRAKWKALMLEKNPSLRGKPISLPVVTSGITHGLSIVADMFADRGDVVLVPNMYWGNYQMIFGVRRGAVLRSYPLFREDGQGFDCQGFRQALVEQAGSRKLIVVLNFPHNPTGYSLRQAEAEPVCEALVEVAQKHDCDVVAVCDDAYFGLFYEPDVLSESIFARLAGRHETLLAVKLDGATKENYVWGFRVAFLTFAVQAPGPGTYEALEKKAAGLIRGTISNCAHHSQSILLKAMSDADYAAQRRQKLAVMTERARRVRQVLSQERFRSVWTPYPFNSGYFMCLRLHDVDAEAFRRRLLDEYGIGVIAAGGSDVRVAFSCIESEEIGPLFDAMLDCAQKMKKGG